VPPTPTDEIVWNAIKDAGYPAIFEDFARKFPASPRVADAQSRRDELTKQIAAAAARIPSPPTADEIVWNAIKDSNYPAIFEDFIGKFPTTPHLADAERRRNELKKQIEQIAAAPTPPPAADNIVWNAIKESRDPAIFEEFVMRYSSSPHLADARQRRDDLTKQIADAAARVPRPPATDEIVWDAIKDARAPQIFEEFLTKFPESSRQKEAKSRLDELKSLVASAVPTQSLSDVAGGRFSLKAGNIGLKVLSDSEEASLKQKVDFRECEKCPEMIVVPAGGFVMGSTNDGPKRASAEAPKHKVTFTHAFAVGRFAVTFEQWDACVDDGGCNGYKPWDNGWGRGKHPAINISWSDAKSYVAWLSERTGKPYRLLSEAEREYVTRAGTSSTFWWGASVSRRQANYDDKTGQYKASKGSSGQRTMPVDSYLPNPWGLYQVHGNIWEWVEDCLNEGYAGAPTDGTAWITGQCDRRVLRGGSWVSSASAVEAGSRYGVQAEGRVSNVGFRVARTLKE
jgi:formylglycine-generating enzyme required for sulfatase activity